MNSAEQHRVELAMNLVAGIVEGIGTSETTTTDWLLNTLSAVRACLNTALSLSAE